MSSGNLEMSDCRADWTPGRHAGQGEPNMRGHVYQGWGDKRHVLPPSGPAPSISSLQTDIDGQTMDTQWDITQP